VERVGLEYTNQLLLGHPAAAYQEVVGRSLELAGRVWFKGVKDHGHQSPHQFWTVMPSLVAAMSEEKSWEDLQSNTYENTTGMRLGEERAHAIYGDSYLPIKAMSALIYGVKLVRNLWKPPCAFLSYLNDRVAGVLIRTCRVESRRSLHIRDE